MDQNDVVISLTNQIMYIKSNYIEGYIESWCWKTLGSPQAVSRLNFIKVKSIKNYESTRFQICHRCDFTFIFVLLDGSVFLLAKKTILRKTFGCYQAKNEAQPYANSRKNHRNKCGWEH